MKKIYYLILVAGVVLITVAIVKKGESPNELAGDMEEIKEGEEQVELSGEQNFPEIKVADGTKVINSGQNYLEGVLYKSEDESRGNLKLTSNIGDIYMRTSRDFGSLVGFQVLVLINGTPDKFELLDIQSRVVKDGYIRQ